MLIRDILSRLALFGTVCPIVIVNLGPGDYVVLMKKQEVDCRQVLIDEFSDRKKRNSSYSLRAFSRDMGVGNTTISDLFAGKRSLSKKNIIKIGNKLSWSPLKIQALTKTSHKKTKIELEQEERLILKDDEFKLISKWYYLAIRSLARLKNNRSDSVWIAQQIGISELEAEIAVDRLKRLGLIQIEKGKMKVTSKPLSTTTDVPSTAIKTGLLSFVERSMSSIISDPVEERDFSTLTMAVDSRKLDEAKAYLKKAKVKLMKILEEGEPNSVYCFNFQLFPLTKKK